MDEVKLKENGGIKGGTLEHILTYLIDECKEPLSIEVFLAAGTHICSALDIWNIVERRYNFYAKKTDSPEGRDKVLKFLWAWIAHDLHRDFLVKKVNKDKAPVHLYDELLRFLSQLSKETANKYKLHILRSNAIRVGRTDKKLKLKAADNADMNGISLSGSSNLSLSSNPLSLSSNSSNAPRRLASTSDRMGTLSLSTSRGSQLTLSSSSFTAPPALVLGGSGEGNFGPSLAPEKVYEMGKVSFCDIEPLDAARQLTLVESQIFGRIQDTEFHHLNWKKEDGKQISPHVLKLVERFNTVSYWVSTEIVTQSELKERVNAVKRFIIIAEHLKDFGNFNGVMEIIGGLNSFVVSRLTATWGALPQRFVTSFNDLNALMDSKSNYREYRNAIKDRRLPLLPYLGIVLRDLLFIEEGNPDYIGDKNDRVINFEKIQLLGEVLSAVRKQQEVGFPFDTNRVLQKYFNSLVYLTEELLYKQSLMCESNVPPPTSNSASNSPHSSASSYSYTSELASQT
eukprot:TRINITY_DN862_c0_g1_i1.p1 TRINITY_DN862_c0_g1~~TRINITY_DN862_c0_g1_i1.p1  ORF type:complete len:512 (+),score=132.05 TRINITY_DN862_c0_g1_i1:295-1830(+)